MMVIGVYCVVYDFGLVILDDVQIIGFNDIFVVQFLILLLIIVCLFVEVIGVIVVDLLVEWIEGWCMVKIVMFDSELIICKSMKNCQ